jgi:hypothetical protein
VSVQIADDIPGKWLELIREAVPTLTVVAVIVNPDNPKRGQRCGSSNSAADRVSNVSQSQGSKGDEPQDTGITAATSQ